MDTMDELDELMYCEHCFKNFHEDLFDYRFEFPVCFECVQDLDLSPTDEYDEE